ncbi:MAG: hypothetical protein CSA66_00930 [Proteobacteria bacterium]|nr:MAG: hypothetical protein CSA66_00930 [Pseudomonadota bacterium]
MTLRLVAALTAALLAAAPALADGPAPARIGLDAALSAAADKNPRLRSGDAAVAAAEAERSQGRARYLPLLRVEGNVMVWHDELAVSFAGEGSGFDLAALPAPGTPYEFVISELLKGLSRPTVVRDQVTAELSVSIIQPLTALISMGDVHELLDVGVTKAELERAREGDAVALQAATAWLQALQLSATIDTIDASLEQLDAQIARVDTLIANDVAHRSDRLGLDVARAQLVQQRLQLEMGYKLACAGLAVSMGGSPSEPVAPSDPGVKPLPAIATTLEADVAFALERRPDTRLLSAALTQARLATSVERDKHIPSVNAIANYRHTEGSSFNAADAFFVGLMLQWDAWDWGATGDGVDAAQARAAQVARMEEAARAGVALEIEQRRLGYEAAVKALAVADRSIAQAEESLRLETARFERGAATVTDVIRAQTALTSARASETTAYYQALLNRAQYLVAAGRPLDAAALFTGGQAQ